MLEGYACPLPFLFAFFTDPYKKTEYFWLHMQLQERVIRGSPSVNFYHERVGLACFQLKSADVPAAGLVLGS